MVDEQSIEELDQKILKAEQKLGLLIFALKENRHKCFDLIKVLINNLKKDADEKKAFNYGYLKRLYLSNKEWESPCNLLLEENNLDAFELITKKLINYNFIYKKIISIEEKVEVDEPVNQLFIWAILYDRVELIEIFLRLNDV